MILQIFSKTTLCTWLCLLGPLAATNASPTSQFPQTYQAAEPALERRGVYRYVYRVFFKLYDAALFAKKEVRAEEILNAKVPFHLEFRYLRTIDKTIILKTADKMLERNLTAAERELIAERVSQLNAAYQTVNKGESSSLTFIPTQGTQLRINDKPIVTIPGDDFARLYFQIWLGEKPISESMKEELIGE
ncbi:MAG: chalcone isomerase family protein [Lentimonas sp.]